MSKALRLGLIAAVLAASAGSADAAPRARLIETRATYPDRAYILALPSRHALIAPQVKVTENGSPVHRFRLSRAGSEKGSESAVVLAIDTSRSMRGKPIADAILAARAFALHRNPHQPLAIVTFDKKVKVLQPFTTDPSKIGAALRTVPTLEQGTRIYDGLDQSLSLIAKAHPASSEIVLLSDGADVGSVAKPAPVLRRLARQHTRVFSVGLASSAFDPQTLGRVARASGGSFVRANQPSDLQRIFAAISARLASEYLLRYRTVVPAGQRVAVKVVAPGVEPARAFYVAPRLVFKDPPPYTLSSTDRLIQSPLAMLLVVLVIALLLGLGIANIARRRPDPLVDRVGGFVTLRSGPVIAEQPRRVPVTARIANRRRQRNRASIGARIAPTLELAGIEQSASEVILLTLGATVLAALILNLLMGPLGILLAVLVVPLGARSFVLGRLRRKRRLFAEQLPDNLEVLTASLRSGHSLVGALAVVAADAQEPSKSEFNRVVADEQFGMPLEDALKVTVERMANPDLDQVALVARLQREMGANSAEVLDRVVDTVRARMELRRIVRTLTAQGRLSRWILTCLPIALALLLSLVSRGYMDPLFHKPLGQLLLALAVVMVATGSWVIGRLVEIEI